MANIILMTTFIRKCTVFFLLIAAAGCNRSHQTTIAVIPKGTSSIFWVAVQAGALAAGQKFNVKILWNGPAQETEYDREIQIVDSMIARRVDGIAVAAAERKALAPPIERAVAAGIPVTVFDSGVDTDKYMTFIATNNYEGGQKGARELASLLGDEGKVGMIMHAPGSASTMDRERGFEDTIKKDFPKIRIAARQYSMSDPSKAMASVENMLTAQPDLDGFFASSEPSSIGAAQALKSRRAAGRVKLVAFDSSEQMINDMNGGVIQAMVVQDPFQMGFQAVQTLVEKLAGKTPPKRIDLTTRVITKPDLSDPKVMELLRPDVKKYLN
ncbi:MAG TPA: substrate-binding domain-containing protein [Bryobacteraceae bacterium]|jgi:ribose transport system substrate-binding protein|nr:substrate-binding domain-containing protein [Bryobacteraceae bacterium]